MSVICFATGCTSYCLGTILVMESYGWTATLLIFPGFVDLGRSRGDDMVFFSIYC